MFLAVLAESAVDSVTGAYASILACETVAKGFMPGEGVCAQLEMRFSRAASVLQERLYRGRPARVSLLAACFIGDQMIYKSVGDLSLVTYHGGELSVAELPFAQVGRKGGITLLCNQGIWQALTEIEVEKLLSGRAHPYQKAQHMIEAVNRRNLKDQKSAVAVIVG